MVQVIIWIIVPHIHIQSRNENQSKTTSGNKIIVQKKYFITQRRNQKAEVLYISIKYVYNFLKSGSREAGAISGVW